MMSKQPTRYYSSLQEQKVAKMIGGNTVANSGAGKWKKGDVVQYDASILIECKTTTSDKTSFSIKKEWLDKVKDDAFSNRIENTAVAFSYDSDCKDMYFVIDEKLMRFLIDKLTEENA